MTDQLNTAACPREDIAAYLDGELTGAAASDLEEHFRRCTICSKVLLEQRQFLASLSASLAGDEGIGLPSNFARRVIAAAESRVTGLRTAHEQFTAIFISAALLFFSMFALGSGFVEIVAGLAAFGEKILTIALFSAKAAGNLFAAATVIARSLFAASTQWLYIAAFAVVALASAAVFRQVFHQHQESANNR